MTDNQDLYNALNDKAQAEARVAGLEARVKELEDEEDLTLVERLDAALSSLEDAFVAINTETLKSAPIARNVSRKWLNMLKKHDLLQVAYQQAYMHDNPDDFIDDDETADDDES